MNMFYIMGETINICTDLKMVWIILGYIILAIQIVVPLLLIISGMITMAQAVMKQKDEEIKKAQNLLVKKIIAAVICFLVIAITKLVVGLVVSDDNGWSTCVDCAFHPGSKDCTFEKINIDTNTSKDTSGEQKPGDN